MPTYTANTRTLTAKPRSKRMQQGAIATAQVVQGGGSVQGNYLPATNNGDGYDVADKVAFLQKIRIGAPDTIVGGVVTQVNGIDIEVDTSNGAVHVKGGLYADDFISAMGLNPDAPTPGGGGLDEDELWTILGGSSTNQHVLPEYLDSVPWASLTGKPGWIGSSKPSYTKSEVGLGNVDNTADANKSVYGVIDYGGSNTIRIGYSGSGLTSSNLTHIAGYTDNGTKIKDVSKSVLKEWLNYTTTDIGALPLSGGTMTGILHLKADQYNGVTAYGMNCHNSDIVNVNSILTADTADSFGEGICFYRSGSGANATWDCLTASGGTFYFGSNKTYGAALSGDANINCSSIKLTNNGGIIVNSENKVILHSNTTDKYTLLNFEGAASQYVTYIDGYDIRFRYGTGHAEGIRLTNAGNVGIGTSSPTEFLHLYKPSAAQNVALFQNSNANVLCGIESGGNGILWNRNNNYIRFGTNATERMRILANGSIAIAQTETTTALDVYGTIRSRAFNANGRSHAAFVWDKAGSNYTGVGSNDETDTIYFGACDTGGAWVSYSQLWKFGGSIYATGAITAGASSSDKRLKKDIKQFNAMSIVDALRPIQFRWNNVAKGLDKYFDTDEIQYGLIAQECDKAMPGLAFKFKANDYYGVRYEKLIPVLLEAIKELKAEIDELKGGRL